MNLFKFGFLLFFVSTFAVIGCSPDENECKSFALTPLTEVTGPAEGQAGHPLTFNVTYKLLSDCAQFSRMQSSGTGTVYVAVEVTYNKCSCMATNNTETKAFTFTPATAGTYTLKFASDTNAYITKTVIVTE